MRCGSAACPPWFDDAHSRDRGMDIYEGVDELVGLKVVERFFTKF
jgi:hypothetical protein